MYRRGETRRCRNSSRFIRRRTAVRKYMSAWMQNAGEVQENTRQKINFLEDRLAILQEHVNIAHNMNARLRDELQRDCQSQTEMLELRADTSFQQTSDMEQMRRQLRTAVLKVEILEKELHMMRSFREDEAADREYERTYMMRRIKQMEERENLLCAVLTDYLSDDSSNESEPEGGGGAAGDVDEDDDDDDDDDNDDDDDDDDDDPPEEEDITEHASWYCTASRELAESIRNPYWESQERAEERSEGVRTSSWLPAVVAKSGNSETTICDVGTASSRTVPPAASMTNGRADGQSERCPICLCGFVTQEVGTPEFCNHSFCADCLQEWLKNTNTCPIDRQVCDTILVRRCLGGEVVRRIHV